MNNLLIQEGLMYLKDTGLYRKKLLPFLKVMKRIQMRLTRRPILGLKILARRAKVQLIDWSRTEAYMLTGWLYGLIYINRKGREKEGIVSPGEPYENLRELISEKISSLLDPQTGKKVIRKVYKREDLFHGSFLERAPDLIVIPEEGYEFNQSFIENPEEIFKINVLKKDHTGIHNQDGIFIINGNDLEKKVTIEKMEIADIFPLILYYMGVEIPEYTDGKVSSGLFSESFVKDNPVRYTAALESQKGKPELEAYSQEEKDMIAKRLKDLGYM